MNRTHREELERRLAQARRLAREPTDPLTRDRLARFVKELELELQQLRRRVA
jgi:TATA-binding protein-associated factor Taf7